MDAKSPSIIFAVVKPEDQKSVAQAAIIWARAAAQRDHQPLPKDGAQALAGVQRRLALPSSRLVLATLADEPAGFTLCAPHDDYLEIYYVAVSPEFWGRGVARQMLDEVDRYALRAGFHHIRLWVIAENSRAMQVYLSCGYQQTGQELVDQSSGRVECLLEKTST
ncbi:GNAT family N-acetyltransferase [Arthrobacter sp. S41]|uniref:GNAT family N-acetyltransferase n=1 Tax=Arthrobacter sp. S41 TaxID=2509721 RepID=UPI00103674F3|nr:GNAT family N-acetyltransferase [Arthrobacter sp. S41]TAP26938.1 GNAT family N-acetyltransferase [Arthrobacter sp. S41]